MSASSVILISGASSGIGKASRDYLRARGHHVYNLDIVADPEDGEYGLMTDLRDAGSIARSVQTVVGRTGRIDGLFANAGKHLFASIEETSEEQLHDLVALNILGVFHLLKQVLPVMKAQHRGSVVLMGSDQAFIGKGRSAVYGMTKGAIGQLTRSTAIDYAPYGIRVNCVCPGTIDTPLLEGAVARYGALSGLDRATIYEGLEKAQPLGRIGQPSEIASVVAFLLSDESSFMTGSLVPVDGGYTCM